MGQWMPRLTQNTKPLSPYRVIWELLHTVDVNNTIITHDAGSPRDQLVAVLGQRRAALLYRLGQDHPARLRAWALRWAPSSRSPTSSASMSGAMRRSALPAWISRPRCASGIPILSILFNNFSMACELNGDAGLDREIPLDRHQRQLRRFRAGARRLWRARDRARRHQCRRSGAASRRPARARRRCSNSSPKKLSTCRASADPATACLAFTS